MKDKIVDIIKLYNPFNRIECESCGRKGFIYLLTMKIYGFYHTCRLNEYGKGKLFQPRSKHE